MSGTTKKAASPKSKGGAAARAEKNGGAPTIDYAGISLTLPDKMGWRTVRAFGQWQASEGMESIETSFNLMERLLGADQAAKVYAHWDERDLQAEELSDEVQAVFEAIFNAYGTEAGESSASTKP